MANTPSRAPLAGGSLLAFSLIAGTIIGASRGQASLGFVGGLAVGVALLVAVWLIDRARAK
ncbi:hypothetical protein ACMGDH_16715 [Sphingomonas sp. DT-207]|uniref:hypothetical protein n=1 Tax=Sphingomonas sp. DT-207 TaxID=3396167 RepID=UPI003F1E2E9C